MGNNQKLQLTFYLTALLHIFQVIFLGSCSHPISGELNFLTICLKVLLPLDIGRSQILHYMSIPGNKISGRIPSIIGNLSDLSAVILYSNKLTGQIPPSICNLRSLSFLHLSNNSLQGPIPQCLANSSKSLNVLHLKAN